MNRSDLSLGAELIANAREMNFSPFELLMCFVFIPNLHFKLSPFPTQQIICDRPTFVTLPMKCVLFTS